MSDAICLKHVNLSNHETLYDWILYEWHSSSRDFVEESAVLEVVQGFL